VEQLYLELLKQSLLGELYWENEVRLLYLRDCGDLYQSTWDALAARYPKVSAGGFVIVDDYHCIPACRRAVDEYCQREGIAAPLEAIGWSRPLGTDA
jgi:hypothetical protein